jgi:hypothetical protein
VRTPEDGIEFHDEFTCPKCRDGVYMDWPPEEYAAFIAAAREPATRTLG